MLKKKLEDLKNTNLEEINTSQETSSNEKNDSSEDQSKIPKESNNDSKVNYREKLKKHLWPKKI